MSNHFATRQKIIREQNITQTHMFNLDDVSATPDKDFNGFSQKKRLLLRTKAVYLNFIDWVYHHRITIMPVDSASCECGPPLFKLKDKIPYRNVLRYGSFYRVAVVQSSHQFYISHNNLIGLGQQCKLHVLGTEVYVVYNSTDRRRKQVSVNIRCLSCTSFNLRTPTISTQQHHRLFSSKSFFHARLNHLTLHGFLLQKRVENIRTRHCPSHRRQQSYVFDFYTVIHVEYQRVLSSSNIRGGFSRATLWPFDKTKIIGQRMPEISATNAPILSV